MLWSDGEETANIGTTSPTMMRRLSKRLGKPIELSPGSWSWTVPKNYITLPRKKTARVQPPGWVSPLKKSKEN